MNLPLVNSFINDLKDKLECNSWARLHANQDNLLTFIFGISRIDYNETFKVKCLENFTTPWISIINSFARLISNVWDKLNSDLNIL